MVLAQRAESRISSPEEKIRNPDRQSAHCGLNIISLSSKTRGLNNENLPFKVALTHPSSIPVEINVEDCSDTHIQFHARHIEHVAARAHLGPCAGLEAVTRKF